MELCKRALTRALQDHHVRLLRQVAPPDAAALRACSVDAAAARLEGVMQQVALTRALKGVFTADLLLEIKMSEKVGVKVETKCSKVLGASSGEGACLPTRMLTEHV